MLTVQYAKDPIYATENGSTIQLTVKFEEFNEEMPFGANVNDPMPYGVDLFNRAIAGEFGEIAKYIPPPTLASGTIPSTDTGA